MPSFNISRAVSTMLSSSLLGIWQDLYRRLRHATASLRGHFEKEGLVSGITQPRGDSIVTKQKMESMSLSLGQASTKGLKWWPSTRLKMEE